jgi:hypothetical protein
MPRPITKKSYLRALRLSCQQSVKARIVWLGLGILAITGVWARAILPALQTGGEPKGTSQRSPASIESAQPSDLATIPERRARHGFPRIGNNTQASWEGNLSNGFQGRELFERLHWYDYAVVDSDAVTNPALGPYLGPSGSIRGLNPNFVVTSYLSPADFVDFQVRYRVLMRNYAFGPTYDPATGLDPDPNDGFNQSEWLYRQADGQFVRLFPFGDGRFSRLQRVSHPKMRDYFVRLFEQFVASTGRVDGIYHDWAVPYLPTMGLPDTQRVDLDGDGKSDVVDWNNPNDPVNVDWRKGLLQLYDLGRKTYPPGFLLVGNSGWYADPVPFAGTLQGTLVEDFNNAIRSPRLNWGAVMHVYAGYETRGIEPRFNQLQVTLTVPGTTLLPSNTLADEMIQQGNNWFTPAQLQELRFGLASTLMFNGYFVTANHNLGGYSTAWWMDEFSVDLKTGASVIPTWAKDENHVTHKGWLGLPLGEAYNIDRPTEKLAAVLAAGPGNSAQKSVWARKFKQGMAIVNPTTLPRRVFVGGSYRKILGKLDPAFNDGKPAATVELPAGSGVVLISR